MADDSATAAAPSLTHFQDKDDSDFCLLCADGSKLYAHKLVLSRVSIFFRDMFTLPQPPDAESLDGCPVVRVSDSVDDLQDMLAALYNSASRYVPRQYVTSSDTR